MNTEAYKETLGFYSKLAEKTAETTDLKVLVESIIKETVLFMNATSGSIMVYDKEDNSLKLYVSAQHPQFSNENQGNKPVASVSINSGIAGEVFTTGKPALGAKNLSLEINSDKLIRREDKGSFVSVPLKHNKKIIGVMNLNRDSELEDFNEDDLSTLKSVETMIASLIEKEKLLAAIEANRKEISGLYALSSILSETSDFEIRIMRFLAKLTRELSLERAAIVELKTPIKSTIYESQSIEIETVAAQNISDGLLKQIFSDIDEEFTITFSRVIADPKKANIEEPITLSFNEDGIAYQMLCVPLFIENSPSHLLLISRPKNEVDQQENKRHLKFLYIISHNVAAAISREMMLKRIRADREMLYETAKRDKVFLDISRDLASTLDPYCILQKSFEQFRRVISFTSIAILLYDELDGNYRLIIQPRKPLTAEYKQSLSDSIYGQFIDYPAEPPLTKEIYKEFMTFKPQDETAETAKSFKHVLHLPVIIGDKVQGLIHLAREENDKPFGRHDLDITSQFTGIFITSIKNAMIHKRTEKLAFTDPLTELFNHRYFQETLNQEFVRTKRYEKPLSLMIIDIDFFKKFNDTYGHLVGDKVLRHVAKIFNKSVRDKIDTVARYGGEEFAVILPETTLEGAKVFAERIRSSVEASRVEHEDKLLSVTLSIGVASTMITECQTTSQLIEAADEALYHAKGNGRNQVGCYLEKQLAVKNE